MFVVVITGSMVAGKSQLLEILEKRSFSVCKADLLAKSFLTSSSPCHGELLELFDGSCLKSDGSFDTKALAKEVFQDSQKLKKLEKILHPLVKEAFDQFLIAEQKKGSPFVFYEVPLVPKNFKSSRFDFIVFVEASFPFRKERFLKKGGKEEDMKTREQHQTPVSEIKKDADMVIVNEGSLEDLEKEVDKLIRKIQQTVKQKV